VKLVWSPLAIERAVAEAKFIAEDKPEAASRWLDGLFSAVDRLATFPNSGHAVPELPRSKYRQLVYKSHRVVFTVEENSVNILTVRRFKQRLKRTELA
jgi:toxin ParE1/3/4